MNMLKGEVSEIASGQAPGARLDELMGRLIGLNEIALAALKRVEYVNDRVFGPGTETTSEDNRGEVRAAGALNEIEAQMCRLDVVLQELHQRLEVIERL